MLRAVGNTVTLAIAAACLPSAAHDHATGVVKERMDMMEVMAKRLKAIRERIDGKRDLAAIKVDQGLPPFPDLLSRDSIKERVHGIMVGELQAMEGAGRTVYDFPDAPWEFTMDMARQVWDESRHVEIYVRLLEHLDGYIGEFPETTILWRCACAEDARRRSCLCHVRTFRAECSGNPSWDIHARCASGTW